MAILDPDAITTLANGGTLSSKDLLEGCPSVGGWIQILDEAGELLALATVEAGPVETYVHPKRVFYTPNK